MLIYLKKEFNIMNKKENKNLTVYAKSEPKSYNKNVVEPGTRMYNFN